MYTNRIPIRRTIQVGLALCLLLLSSLMVITVQAADPLIGQPFLIDAGPGDRSYPAMAYNSQRNQFLVAYEIGGGWYSLALLTHLGNSAWDPPIVNLSYGARPALAYNSARDQYLLVWQEYDTVSSVYKIRGLHLQNNGITAIGNAFDIATSTWELQQPAVAFNNHPYYEDYLVVWRQMTVGLPSGWWEIWGQRVAGTSGGGLIGPNFRVAGNPVTVSWNYSEPDVAYNLNMNEYLVVYTREPVGGGVKDVYSRRVTRDGNLPAAEQDIDNTANDQQSPAVAAYRLNQNTPYLVAYTDYYSDASGDVRARLIDKQGQWQHTVNVATVPGRKEGAPDVASAESLGYTVVWSQEQDDWNVYGRRVSDTGNMEPAFDISRYGFVAVPCHEQSPVVAGGSPVAMVVWKDNCLGGGSNWKIAGRMLGYQVDLPLVLKTK
jgi:hypothetical protein